MKAKLYFASFDMEMARTKETWIDIAKLNSKTEFELIEAKPIKDAGFFWCREFEFAGEKSEVGCGKYCPSYSPRNGKSGCCKHYSTTFYEPTEKKETIKL